MVNKILITGRQLGKSTWLAYEAKHSRYKAMLLTATTNMMYTARIDFGDCYEQVKPITHTWGIPDNIGIVCIDEVAICDEGMLASLVTHAILHGIELRLAGTPTQYEIEADKRPQWLRYYQSEDFEIAELTKKPKLELLKLAYGYAPVDQFMSEYLGQWVEVNP
jgi:hypothetical protein